MKNAKKSLAVTLAILMVVGLAVGGTLAWLTDATTEVKNTFTASNVDADLTETMPVGKTAQMIPGYTIQKDPAASVTATSEDCYLFVKVTEEGGDVTYTAADGTEKTTQWSDFLTYAIADGWLQLKDKNGNNVAGVYYKIFNEETKATNVKGTAYSILAGNVVTVNENVTNEMMAAVTEANRPTLSFQAYACQYMKNNTDHFEPYEAWAKINP